MYRYKRLLVNLSLNDNDSNLINISSVLAQMAKSEKLYFLFTEKRLDVPDDIVKEYPQLTESVADFAREKINKMIGEVFTGKDKPEIHIIIQEGEALDELLKQVRINGIDLVLVGVSLDQPESVSLGIKLARKAPCSVFVIPEKSAFDLKNPAVAVDFSENSADAVDAALAFSKAARVSTLKTVHIYDVPTGYHKTGKSFGEFSEIMKGHAQKRFSDFKGRFNPEKIRIDEIYIQNARPAEAIRDVVEKKEITFLAVGSRGRSAGASVMLGSVSERLIESLRIPVLAVKKKGTGLNILDAIFN